jgi:hypothetical protein
MAHRKTPPPGEPRTSFGRPSGARALDHAARNGAIRRRSRKVALSSPSRVKFASNLPPPGGELLARLESHPTDVTWPGRPDPAVSSGLRQTNGVDHGSGPRAGSQRPQLHQNPGARPNSTGKRPPMVKLRTPTGPPGAPVVWCCLERTWRPHQARGVRLPADPSGRRRQDFCEAMNGCFPEARRGRSIRLSSTGR